MFAIHGYNDGIPNLRDKDLFYMSNTKLKLQGFLHTFGLYLTSISAVDNNLAYILFGSLVKISFHGVQMDIPRPKDLPILKMTIQMIYHKYVSKKKRIRSMTYMIVSVNGT